MQKLIFYLTEHRDSLRDKMSWLCVEKKVG